MLIGTSVLAGLGIASGAALTVGRPPQGPRRGAMVEAPVDQADLPRWRSDIDTLAAHGQTLVRTGVYPWLVAPRMGVWDDDAADFYRDALRYARRRGLDVNLVVPGAPDWAQSSAFGDYQAACSWFWTSMAEAFDHQVLLWQVFNEADHSHYRRFTTLEVDDSYLGELHRLLVTARGILGRDGHPITTNLTGWPMDDAREQSWYEVLDVLADVLDVISLDLYPADNPTQIDELTGRIDRVRDRYGRPVFVAEIGLQTAADSWSEEEQHRFLPAALSSVLRTDVWGVCLYQLRDQPSPPGFGITRSDGTPKPAFGDVMGSLV